VVGIERKAEICLVYFPAMKPAEVLFETSIWRKRPHFSQGTREMGHPLVLTMNYFI